MAGTLGVGAAIEHIYNEIHGTPTPSAEKPGSTLKPGEHAGDSIPARGPGRDFTRDERDKINEIGGQTGCHTCGSKDPGTKSGDFVPDHQPPSGTNADGKPQRLYPQCLGCSRKQGGEVRQQKPTSPGPTQPPVQQLPQGEGPCSKASGCN